MAAIASGKLNPGDRLPSVRKLSEEVGVAVNTVARAYRDLEVMGVLLSRRGMGVFVSKGAVAKCRTNLHRRIRTRMSELAAESHAVAFPLEKLETIIVNCYKSGRPHKRNVRASRPMRRWAERFERRMRSRFLALAAVWKAERGVTSSITEMVMHPAYQEIVGMGPDALPLIIEELGKKPDHWFWALRAITGEDPVPAGSRGNVDEMAQAWVEWAQKDGHAD